MIEKRDNKHCIRSVDVFYTPETGEELQAMTDNTNDPPGAMRMVMHTLNFVAKLAKEAPIFNEPKGEYYPFWIEITEDECEALQNLLQDASEPLLQSIYAKIS